VVHGRRRRLTGIARRYCTICGEHDDLVIGRRVPCCWRPQCLAWLSRLGVTNVVVLDAKSLQGEWPRVVTIRDPMPVLRLEGLP
jgi:hypothetical protein